MTLLNTDGFQTGGQRELFGLRVDALSMDEVVGLCDDAITERRPTLIGMLNAAKIVNSRHDAQLLESLLECDVMLADGQSVVMTSRLVRRPLPERVAGIDLFIRLLEHADATSRSVYLLGAKPDVLRTLVGRISDTYPNLRIAGYRDGYFTSEQEEDVAAEIRTSGADMLFLGIVSPKKENFLRRWGNTLDVPVLHGVGGSFDVLAGITQRAPEAWQRAGFEWLYRVIQEPRRLWRRYLTTNIAFLGLTAREMVRPTPGYPVPQRLRSQTPIGVIDLRESTYVDLREDVGATPAQLVELVREDAVRVEPEATT